MLKHGVLTILMSMLFIVTPVIACDKDNLSQEYKDNLEANREAKNRPHPAHEMGSDSNPFNNSDNKYKNSNDKKNLSQDYKDNLEANREAKNRPHPAHEMGADSNPFNNSCAEMGREISSDTVNRCQDYLNKLQGRR